MAFFTRTKATVPILPDEEDILSEDDWEEELQRRTPDGRSSKTSYERRETASQSQGETKEQNQLEQVIECKNPCLNPEPCYENLPVTKRNDDATETENNGAKTEDVRYDFVVDRVLGVQV